MANRDSSIYSAFDLRRYLAPEDYKAIYDYSNAKYNLKGWQNFGTFGVKQNSRIWGNVIKEDEVIVKASTLAVGAPKPIRSTSGWERYAGSIFKVGHGVKIEEDDLLQMQELAASANGGMQKLMLDAMIAKSDNLIIGIHNKLTSWVYKGLSCGKIADSDSDGISFEADLRVPGNHKVTPATGKSWWNISGNTWTENASSDPIQDLLDAQQLADDENIPYDHWEITKFTYRKFINHSQVLAKVRNHMPAVVTSGYIPVENEILNVLHEFGVAPFRIVDEKSAKEIDGISTVDTDSFDKKALVLCNSGSDLFEIKNAKSVYEEVVAAGGSMAAQYSFTGDNGVIAVMNEWKSSPAQNIFEAEAWFFPVLRNPKHILIFNFDATHSW